MKINDKIKKNINNSVVRIIAESININWNIPYIMENPEKGQGTGFFIKSRYILTCSHVVDSAKNVYIEIPSIGIEKYQCDIIFICPHYDIAMLKTKDYESNYVVKLGNSDKLQSGDEVYVVGYPASFRPSNNSINNLKFTKGIINGQQYGLIQTDSTINPGNSGGPLFYKNKVIGINSRKLVSNSIENVGYAVPINSYKIIKDKIFFTKDVKETQIIYRPNLLIDFDNTQPYIIKDLTNNKVDNGIIISKIYNFSILNNKEDNKKNKKEDKKNKEDTNIRVGSIITKINNININNYGLSNNYWIGTQIDFNNILNKFKNNTSIKIEYYNDNIKHMQNIILKPYIPIIRRIYPVFEKVDYFIIAGVIFMNFSLNNVSNSKNNLDILCVINDIDNIDKPKLFVSFIFPNSLVNIINNIKKNNFISKVNDISVNTINELKKAIMKPIKINNKLFIKIEESHGSSILLSIDDVIKQDIILSETYKYELNDFHKKYQ
jgi:S1-C subfamily serine protease